MCDLNLSNRKCLHWYLFNEVKWINKFFFSLQVVTAWTRLWPLPPRWRTQEPLPLGRAHRLARRHHPILPTLAEDQRQAHIIIQEDHKIMQEVFKDRVLLPAELEVLQVRLLIKVLRQDRQHHNILYRQHQVDHRHRGQDHRQIQVVFHRRPIILDHHLMDPVVQIHLVHQREHRNLSVDLDHRDLLLFLLAVEIHIFHHLVNHLVVLNMECHLVAPTVLEDIRWAVRWDPVIRRWWALEVELTELIKGESPKKGQKIFFFVLNF